MKKTLFPVVAIFGYALSSGTVSLSGTVIDLDSLPKAGVVVSLTGTDFSDTTGTDGTWSLVTPKSTGLAFRSGTPTAIANHLALVGGRLRVSLAGYDPFGRSVAASIASTAPASFKSAARAAALAPDTLIYSWKGGTILRDTISQGSLTESGIIRHFDTTVNPMVTYGYLTDPQGHVYRDVRIGQQTWMAENLDFKVDSSWCYMDSSHYCGRFGRLYQWAAVMDIDTSFDYATWGEKSDSLYQGICPQNWHVPSDSEWAVLYHAIDSATSGTILKSTSGWFSVADSGTHYGNGIDSLGFKAMGAGYRNSADDTYHNLYTHTAFWSSTEADDFSPFTNSVGSFVSTTYVYIDSMDIYRLHNYKDLGFSLRCLKDPQTGN
jgi:uncharacterized protein (TIGR02145 family)